MKRIIGLGFLAALLMSLPSSQAAAQGTVLQNVELHGYAQNRFYANPSSTARFVVERVSLSTSAQLPENRKVYVEVYFTPWSAAAPEYLESAYLDMPVGVGNLRIGKGRQLNFGITPTYPNRKTSQYGILSETFTADRIVGAQYAVKKGLFDLGASLYTDTSLGTRNAGDFAGSVSATDLVPHFADRDAPTDNSGRLAGSMRLGMTSGCWQVHLSGATGSLNPKNLTGSPNAINNAYNRLTNTNTDHNKYGADATYSSGPFVAQGEWYQGQYGFLKITGYSALVGYQPKDKPRVYVRYAALNNDQTPNDNAVTWDIQQLTFGVVKPISKGVWLELNYERNTERPAANNASIDNDVLFLELFTGF